MKSTSILLLLAICSIGCGYSSNGTKPAGAPAITQLVPNSMAAGSGAFTLTVMGTNMANGAVVYWDANTRPTTFVSAAKVTAAITAADIATAGTVLVYVKNPAGTGIYMNQGGQSSTTVPFTITP
jgi:hypothetical protein